MSNLTVAVLLGVTCLVLVRKDEFIARFHRAASPYGDPDQHWLVFVVARSGPVRVGVTTDPNAYCAEAQKQSHMRGTCAVYHAERVNDPEHTSGMIHNELAAYTVNGDWYRRRPTLDWLERFTQSNVVSFPTGRK